MPFKRIFLLKGKYYLKKKKQFYFKELKRLQKGDNCGYFKFVF